jgi:hypothetical protein
MVQAHSTRPVHWQGEQQPWEQFQWLSKHLASRTVRRFYRIAVRRTHLALLQVLEATVACRSFLPQLRDNVLSRMGNRAIADRSHRSSLLPDRHDGKNPSPPPHIIGVGLSSSPRCSLYQLNLASQLSAGCDN